MKTLVTLCCAVLIAGCSIIKPNPKPPAPPAPTPKPVPGPPPMPPGLRRLVPRVATIAPANVSLAWDYNLAANPGIRFKLYSGASAHNYTNMVDVGTNLSATAPASAPTNHYAVTAYSTNGLESPFSAEAIYALPAPNVAYLYVQTNATLNANTWGLVSSSPLLIISNAPQPALFYRLLIIQGP